MRISEKNAIRPYVSGVSGKRRALASRIGSGYHHRFTRLLLDVARGIVGVFVHLLAHTGTGVSAVVDAALGQHLCFGGQIVDGRVGLVAQLFDALLGFFHGGVGRLAYGVHRVMHAF